MDILNKKLHLVPIELDASDKFSRQFRCVELGKIEERKSVHFTIYELEEELKKIDKEYAHSPIEKKLKRKHIIDLFDELQWVAIVSPQIIDSPEGYNINDEIEKGIDYGENIKPQRRISFPRLLVGGGFVYVGAKFPDSSKFKSTKFQGLFYQAFGTPSIVRMEWTDMDGNSLNGETVLYNSHVKLNIYTRDLYGQELDIYLYDYDSIDDNDLLPISGNDFFTREVEYQKASGNTETKDIVGKLTNSVTNTPEKYCQIVSFKIHLDSSWQTASKIGEAIKIFPKVKVSTEVEFLKIPNIDFLNVSKWGKKVGYQKISDNNMPVVVYEIETNIHPFHPCGYTTISISEGKREKVEIFNQKKSNSVLNPFELVAGDKQSAVKTIIIELDDKASSKECTLNYTNKTSILHTNNVFNIVKYPEKEISNNHEKEKSSRIKIEKKSSSTLGGFSVGSSDNFRPENTGLKVLKKDDKHIEFEARFLYNRNPIDVGVFSLSYLYRYIWVISDSTYQQYVVQIGSCRFGNQLVDIHVFPNLAWALRLEYTAHGEMKSFSELNKNQTYTNTRNATFQREPKKWIKVGKRNLGIKLEAKVINDEDKDKENEQIDISAEAIQVIEEKLRPVVKLLEFLKTVINGDGANQNMTPAEQERMNRSRSNVQNLANNNSAEIEERRRVRQRQQLAKDKENFKNNKKILKSAEKSSKEYKDALKRNKNLQRYMDKHNGDLTRSVVGVDLTYPDFGLEFEWKRVPVTSETHKNRRNRTGFEITGKFEASPIIGARVFLDFLALAQKLHPIALAVVAALDLTLKAIGDGSRIIAEFSIDMQIEGSFEGFYNTLTGENTFNTKSRQENEKHLVELGGKLKFQLLFAIHLQTEKKITNVFTGKKYVGKLEAGVELKADAEFIGKSKFYVDKEGFYGNASGEFEGISVSIKAELSGNFGEIDEDPIASISKGVEMTFEAIPASAKNEIGKFYIVKNEK